MQYLQHTLSAAEIPDFFLMDMQISRPTGHHPNEKNESL
tara:strand:+ start:438 stop:554 length:117 start_codon:yes stop_codon:yes gene_type:complete